MSRLAIHLLGPFQAILDSERVNCFETEKVRALLAYLAAEADRPQRREFLAELLWPDRPEGAARANLRHALGNLRTIIGDRVRSAKPTTARPFLLVTRDTIQLNREADLWVDTQEFVRFLLGPTPSVHLPITQLEAVAGLYRGDFLEDIAVSDSAAFHEWALLKREGYRRQALDVLHRLIECYKARGEYERALTYAWRRVELAPWDETAHQHVMRLLAYTGQRTAALAQFEHCRHLLAEELRVEPEPETIQLYEQIRAGELVPPAVAPSLVAELDHTLYVPAFRDGGTETVKRPIFVAREGELARLNTLLDAALRGRAGFAFVTGGPGQGKTALLGEFARRAMDNRPELLVVSGNCSAYTGIGDPYLPFRDMLGMLTGDVQTRWAAGGITRDHACRLWNALPTAVQALIAHGTSLIGTVLPGEALLPRVAAALPDHSDWLGILRALTERARTGVVDLEQSHLFEQYTNVLLAVAERHPLVLLLDDLQWADNASVALLFHLGRRLAGAGSRIFIACAYRPEEVALGRPSPAPRSALAANSEQRARTGQVERHPLESALTEFKRTYGDVWLDLARADQREGRRFVDALLDAQPNSLGEDFRAALFRHTQGHPLFTVELLRTMQERGDLVQDNEKGWIEGPCLNWEVLPARVEAVIAGRIGRLDPELSHILTVASVEGEVFTAQVVGRVLKMSERELLGRLAQELERQHRLVREQGELTGDQGPMTRYRFGHILFQDYLYRRLSRGERRLLHGEVAAATESVYEGRLDEVAVQLAHHYRRGGDYYRACLYFSQAAENAARVYANDEAIAHYTQAIELAEGMSLDAASQAKLYRGRGLVFETIGQFERARADHQAILQAARAAGERHLEWRALIDLGKLWASRDYDRTHQCFQNALELARSMDEPAVLAGSLNWMGNWYLNTEDLPAAKAQHREALEIFERLGDRQGLAATLDLLGITSLLGGDAAAGVACYDRAIALFRELCDRPGLASSLTGRGHAGCATYSSLAMVSCFTPDEARCDFEEAICIARDIGSPAGEAWALWSLGLLYMVQGQFGKGLEVTQRSLAIATDIGHREWIVGSRSILGSLYVEMLAPKQARVQLGQALVLARELRSQHWIHQATGSLAAAHRLLNDTAGAQTCLETVLSPNTSMDTLHKRYCWVRRAELALCQADPGLALDITERLIATAPGMSPGCVIAFLWKLRGQALAALGQVDEALALLKAALDNAHGLGERAFAWDIHVSLAHLYAKMDQRPEAEQALDAARALIEELAATIPDEALEDNFLQRALGTIQSSS